MREPEPDFIYDLSINYEDLFLSTEKIKQDILNVFGITIKGNWLEKFKKDYDLYNTTIRSDDSIFLQYIL